MARPAMQRDAALDQLKGLLVVAMLIYHAMNYFSTAGPAAYGWLRFVNGAFVFLAGWLAARGAAGRELAERRDAARRLLQRGGKLLLLFSVLNLALAASGTASYKPATPAAGLPWGDALVALYLTGDGPQIAFRILVPIAYTLLVAAVATLASPPMQWVAAWGCAALAALYTALWPAWPTPYFLLIGLCGWGLGGLTADGRSAPWRGLPLALAVVLLLAAMDWLSGNVLACAVGLAALMKLLRDAVAQVPLPRLTRDALALLGRYSLLGYIGQIAVLFALHRLLGGPRWPLGPQWLLVCAATLAVLLLACGALARLRSRSAWVDRGYRAVFA